MDLTEEIRAAIRNAKEHGWAARLRYALSLLDKGPAAAIIENVCRELEPDVQAVTEKASWGEKQISPMVPRMRTEQLGSSEYGGQRGSEAGCYS